MPSIIRKPLELTMWGVRGSVPTPVAGNMGFGGNTACIAIRCGNDAPLIFDAGSGIRELGDTLREERAVHVFLTHFHWDHIQGLPLFAPMFDPDCKTTIHSRVETAQLRNTLASQMAAPYYPVGMPAHVEYAQVSDEGTRTGDVLVTPFALHHPNGATGYRIESPDRCVVYASDHEHGDAAADDRLLQYAHDADVLIYDAQYTPEEYDLRRGWGHSTWREGVRVALQANVKQLILFHHDPRRTDRQLEAIVREAQEEFENTIAAREGGR